MLLFKKGKKFNQKLGISLANIFLYVIRYIMKIVNSLSKSCYCLLQAKLSLKMPFVLNGL